MENDCQDISFEDALVAGIVQLAPKLITGYPGYPVTSIFEKILRALSGREPGASVVEWSINETVALENAVGASFANARAVVLMKNHGTNTVLDPLVNLSYTGARGGLLLISADDLEVRASHNDFDSRLYGWVTKIPVLELATVSDAYHFISLGCQLSEVYHTPVFMRITGTQLQQTGKLEVKNYVNSGPAPNCDYRFSPDSTKFFVGPANYLSLKEGIRQRLQKIRNGKHPHFNRMIKGSGRLGVICAGSSYDEVVKLFPTATILSYGITFPISHADLHTFVSHITGEEITIVENQEPLIEMQVKEYLYQNNNTKKVNVTADAPSPGIVPFNRLRQSAPVGDKTRTPGEKFIQLCPSCPARGILLGLKELKIKVMGDAGCTALGCLPPFQSVHSGTCMGASIATAAGVNKVSVEKVVALIGDSAFFHSGLPGLLNELGKSTELFVILFNNNRSALTGNQITFPAIQTHPHSSEQILHSLIDFGVCEKNISIIKRPDSMDLAIVKNEISRFYRELKKQRILIIEGHCPYNIIDFWTGRIRKKGEVEIVEGLAVNPGCFACEELGGGNFRIHKDLCRGCTQCKDIRKIREEEDDDGIIKRY